VYPERTTERLILRGFRISDAATVQILAGSRAIAEKTVNIPHPYEDGMAEEWIDTHEADLEDGNSVNFAICLKHGGELIGAIGLSISSADRHAELGYWIAQTSWGNGYATEAADEMLDFGFTELDLNKIHAHHMTDNPASGQVMQKIGMKLEGTLRQHIVKWGHVKDLDLYGILKDDWLKHRK
jgi:RimJ/RimL family protein N-acetyltransferase